MDALGIYCEVIACASMIIPLCAQFDGWGWPSPWPQTLGFDSAAGL